MKIKVCGLPFEVTGVDGGHLVSHNKERTDLYGEVSYVEESIRIDNSKSIEMMNQTFWHEVIHVIVERLNIRELRDADNNHNEMAIDQLALGVFSVLQSLDCDAINNKGDI
jgi:predicted metal-dependent peptidase